MILAIASLVMALTVSSIDDDPQVEAGNDDFNASIETTDLSSQDHHVTTTTDGGGKPEIRDSDLDALCVATAITIGEDPFVFCDIPPTDDVEITPEMVAAAFARVPVPASKIEVQPANGRTLASSTPTSSRALGRSTCPSRFSVSAWICTSCRLRSVGGSGTASRW